MMNFAEQTIDKESQNLFNEKITEHYEEMMRTFYNSHIADRSQQSASFFKSGKLRQI